MSVLVNRRTLRDLRRAQFRRNPQAPRFTHARHALVRLPGRLWRTGIFSILFVMGVLIFLGGGVLADKGEPLQAASGYFAAKWTLCGLWLASLLQTARRARPEVPEFLCLAPVEPELLGRRAQRLAVREVLKVVAAFTAATVLITAFGTTSRLAPGRPFHWWLLPLATLSLWVHLVAVAACAPALWRAAVRSPWKLSRWPKFILILLLVAGFIMLIGAPFGLAGKNSEWITPPGSAMAAVFPAAGLLAWPVTQELPVWQLGITGLLLVLGWPELRRFLHDLRQLPEVTNDIQRYWGPSCDEEDWDEEESIEASTAAEALTATPVSPGIPPPAEPAMLRGLAASLRERRDAEQCQADHFLTNPYGKVRAAVPNAKGLLFIFILFGGAVACGFPLIYGAAWIFLAVCGFQFAPTALHAQYPYCFGKEYYSGQSQSHHEWLPLDVSRAWQVSAPRYNEAIRATLYPALLLAGIGAVVSLLLRPLQLLPYFFEAAAFMDVGDTMPATWRCAAACAIAILGAPVAHRQWAPSPFVRLLIPRERLTWTGRLLHQLCTTMGGLASLCAVLGVAFTGLGIVESASIGVFLGFVLASAILFVSSELLRLASLRMAFLLWSRGKRK